MNYYRSFANLIGAIGVITLGLILAVVLYAWQAPQPDVEVPAQPAADFDPPWASKDASVADELDPDMLAPLKEPVPPAPSRLDGSDWLPEAQPMQDTAPELDVHVGGTKRNSDATPVSREEFLPPSPLTGPQDP